MSAKGKKITIQRELKSKVSEDVLKAINKATKGYGGLITLARIAKLPTATILRIRNEKKATPTILGKVTKALKQAA